MSTPKVFEHIGLKYLHLVIVAVLAIIALFFKFGAWLAGTVDITSLGIIYVMLLGFELIAFLIQLTWKFFEKYMTQIIKDYKPLGLKTVILFAIITLGLIWLLFNFFTVLPLAVIPLATLQTFWFGLTILWASSLFIFFLQIVWAVAHRASEM